MNSHLPSSSTEIRPATFADIPFIQNIAHKTWAIAYTTIISHQQLDYMLHKFYSAHSLELQMQEHHYFFIALNNYKAVGFASFSKVENFIYKLQKLYVLPEQQKTGLGKKLLETVETAAKNKGANRLQLNVNRSNIAKAFYEKNDFKIIREEDIDIGSGYFMNDYIMEKMLA